MVLDKRENCPQNFSRIHKNITKYFIFAKKMWGFGLLSVGGFALCTLALLAWHGALMTSENQTHFEKSQEVAHTFFKIARLEMMALERVGQENDAKSASPFPPSLIYTAVFDHKERFSHEAGKWLALEGSKCPSSPCPTLFFEKDALLAYLGATSITKTAQPVGVGEGSGRFDVSWDAHTFYTLDISQKQFMASFVRERLVYVVVLMVLLCLSNVLYYGGLFVGTLSAKKDHKRLRATLVRELEEAQTKAQALENENKRLEKDGRLLTQSRALEARLTDALRRRTFVDVGRLGTLSSLLEETVKGNARLDESDIQAFLGDMTQTSKSLCLQLPHLLNLEPVNVFSLVQECVDLLQYDALKSQVRLVIEEISPASNVRTDALFMTLGLLFVLKKTLSRMYSGQIFVSFTTHDQVPALGVRWQGEGVREDHFLASDTMGLAGLQMDERVMEELCKKLQLKIVRCEQATFLCMKNVTSENPFSSSLPENGNVIPLFA